MPNNDTGRGGLGTVRNAVHLLELLSQGPAFQQLTDLAERSQLSVPTVHRLLRSLVLAELAVQDKATSRYGLGPELTRLSHHYLTRLPLLSAASPYLSQVREQVGGTVHVEVLVDGEVVYVDRVDGGSAGPYREGNRVHPALATAGGRLLAARADEPGWARALERAEEVDRADAADGRASWAEVEWLAHRPADLTLPAEIAVLVLGADGHAAGALAAEIKDDDETTISRAAAHLSRAAKAAGRTLGNA